MSEAAIVCRNICFSYLENGREILKNTSLTIPAGKITVLMGSSGCGKSTLAAVLCGLLPENGGFLKEGEVFLFDRPLREISVSERASFISMMFQNPDLQFCMPTLREELLFCAENVSVPPEKMEALLMQAAEHMQTTKLLDRPLYTLSGGEKQRAVLTCQFMLNARCIVLDEAFANLDPSAIKELLPFLAELCHQEGKTILAIDHMSDHWLGIADRFVLLGQEGTILLEAESPDALEQARPIFEQEGIAYPGIWESKPLKRTETKHTEKGVLLDRLSISQIPQKKSFRNKASEVKKEDALYYEADAVIQEGRITALMGPSGCGKTTLMMTLLKQRAYGGSIYPEGTGAKELRNISPKECFRWVGIAFQNPSNQFVTQNVLEEVMDGLKRRYPNESEEQRKERALSMLDSCGLRKYQKYSPYMLSQGQQRRLAVLAVLAAGGKVLLLDEPTYGQDYRSACALMEMISERVREEGLTVLMSTHDKGLAKAFADVILHVQDGKIFAEEDAS